MRGSAASTTSSIPRQSGPPYDSAIANTRFFNISNWADSDSLRLATSASRAEFSPHAAFAFSTALPKNSELLARRFMVSVCLIDLMPRSSSIWDMFPPDWTAPSMPTSTADRAPTASLPQACLKSAADMLAVCAHVSMDEAFVATSLSMVAMMVEMAVPPASASMPMDDSAVARPSTSASVSPIDLPAPAILMAMWLMSASVVAKLLPRATMVEP